MLCSFLLPRSVACIVALFNVMVQALFLSSTNAYRHNGGSSAAFLSPRSSSSSLYLNFKDSIFKKQPFTFPKNNNIPVEASRRTCIITSAAFGSDDEDVDDNNKNEKKGIINGEDGGSETLADLMSQNQLTHAMIHVQDMNATIEYWIGRGATLQRYGGPGKGAFVGFTDDTEDVGYFSLELAPYAGKNNFKLGNAIEYAGLSMLLNFDLRSAAAGEKPASPSKDVDPNGIEIRSVAAAPGDSFSRFCLRTKHGDPQILEKTTQFYKTLGMNVVAGDDTCTCLRYAATQKENDTIERIGVATTLVFTKSDDDDGGTLDYGNCFDHLAISTTNVEKVATALRATLISKKDDDDNEEGKENKKVGIFMEPTPMFGTTVMGLYDPNGYKVYLVEQ
mmetsp:Transcript_17782/g.25032  ORF Transcript_17782/g.25032 Transcript_17782/m.25032 type:complete len:392 (+) Transcript_17782:215-1390(+)